jgi:hypothetical protein
MRICSIIVCLLIICGCSVQSSQVSALMDIIKKPANDIPLYEWSVKYADYEAIVYPVNTPQGTLFSNQAGDQVLFDGWSVRRFSGLGLRGPAYQNRDISNQRTFMRGSRSLGVHQCNQWQQKKQSGKKQFSQSCQGDIIYSNSIFVDQDGSISVIQQIVDDRYEPLILTRLN